MKSIQTSVVLALTTLTMVSPIAWTRGRTPSAGPRDLQRAIAAALSEKTPSERESALCGLLSRYLLSEDRHFAERTYAYLLDQERWLDVRPCKSVFVEFSERIPYERNSLFSLNGLRRSSRIERWGLYREAIEMGEVRLPGGFVLTRSKAMIESARDGINELECEINKYYDDTRQSFRNNVSLEFLIQLIELRAGGKDREEAIHRGVKKIAELGAEEFRVTMETDKDFFLAAKETITLACETSPFDGSQNPGCKWVLNIYFDQRQLEASRYLATSDTESTTPSEYSEFFEWILSLGGKTIGGESILALYNQRSLQR